MAMRVKNHAEQLEKYNLRCKIELTSLKNHSIRRRSPPDSEIQ
ncbi:hypothetical protein NHE_0345 [Neorickettsia helminthoeca str. Oregon]|uniref:Uncharacterized protein n=1 Tax=Neorickettsia helminthoeca str. Oregon TaxID=1286528 RepID=X5GW45_9RICK|nr:hypothetical protein NHE_0345 [Neorickettsia helminthoeca str. Oregon]